MPEKSELGIRIDEIVTSPDKYGSAEISSTERTTLRELYQAIREEVFGSETTLSLDDRKLVRELVTESIINDGWPKLKNLNTKDLAETAVSHACIVVEDLYQKRGTESLPDLVWSYATKNQFDRYVEKVLKKNNKLDNGEALGRQWSEPSSRKEQKGGAVNYPDLIDSRLVHGIGKATRYWPAQLMRYLESIRLSKSGPEELKKYKVGDTDREKYKIPWSNFDEVIKQAENIEDITVGVAIKTLEVLKERGLSVEQLVTVIANCYSPAGVIGEHGHVVEIDIVWDKLLQEINTNPKLTDLYSQLLQEYKNRVKQTQAQ